jgi:hypothetical protein
MDFGPGQEQKAVDCFAKGAWVDKYKSRFDGPSYPTNCPMFLSCNGTDDAVRQIYRTTTDEPQPGQFYPQLGWETGHEKRRKGGGKGREGVEGKGEGEGEANGEGDMEKERWVRNFWKQLRTPATDRKHGIDSDTAAVRRLRHVVHKLLTKKGFQHRGVMSRHPSHYREVHPKFAGAHPSFAGPMPDDPINQCTVEKKRVEAFHEVRREAPTVFWMLGVCNALRIIFVIPLIILWSMAFWWGNALWSRLQDTSYRQTYQSQVVSFSTPHQQGTELGQMAQPLVDPQTAT